MDRRSGLTAIAVAIMILAADQASKSWAAASLPVGKLVTAVPGWLWFRLTQNTGATFSLLRGQNLLFAGASLVVLVAVAAILARGYVRGVLVGVALGGVAGGAMGNLADRVRLGGVIDFIEVRVWPTDFNLADAAIRIGVALFITALILDQRRRSRAGRRARGAR